MLSTKFKVLKKTSDENLFGTVFGFIFVFSLLFFFNIYIYIFLVWQVEPVLQLHRTASGNDKMVTTPLATIHAAALGASSNTEDSGEWNFLWTRSFTYRNAERKLKIKLFDRLLAVSLSSYRLGVFVFVVV